MGKMYKVTGELLRNLAGTITNAAAIDRIVTVHFVDEIPQDIIASNEAAYRPSDQTIWIRKGATLPPMIANLVHELGHHAIKMREGGDAEHVAYDICARRVLELEAALAAAREENERLRELEENEDWRRRLGNAEYQINFMLTSISKITGVEAKSPVDAVHHVFDLMGYCKNRDEQLAALTSRSEGSVERAARKWSEIDADHGWANFDELPQHQRDELLKCARAVLAAADREGE